MHAKTMLFVDNHQRQPLNCTCSWKMACVPTIICTCRWRWLLAEPVVLYLSVFWRAAYFDTERCKPVTEVIGVLLASNSVGAIRATCLPWATARKRRGRRPAFYRNLHRPAPGAYWHIQRHIALDLRHYACLCAVGLNGKAARSLFFSASLVLRAGHENAVLRHVRLTC